MHYVTVASFVKWHAQPRLCIDVIITAGDRDTKLDP